MKRTLLLAAMSAALISAPALASSSVDYAPEMDSVEAPMIRKASNTLSPLASLEYVNLGPCAEQLVAKLAAEESQKSVVTIEATTAGLMVFTVVERLPVGDSSDLYVMNVMAVEDFGELPELTAKAYGVADDAEQMEISSPNIVAANFKRDEDSDTVAASRIASLI